jgi:hypothetical protein
LPGHFLDSSALVKLYHPEVGTPAVDQIVNASDIATGKLEVFSIEESEFTTAELLVERYAFDSRLRALDALQLAVALELRNRKLVEHFVAADAILCEVARLEGFSVINPEHS